jgi:hypothetical protein
MKKAKGLSDFPQLVAEIKPLLKGLYFLRLASKLSATGFSTCKGLAEV